MECYTVRSRYGKTDRERYNLLCGILEVEKTGIFAERKEDHRDYILVTGSLTLEGAHDSNLCYIFMVYSLIAKAFVKSVIPTFMPIHRSNICFQHIERK